MYTWESRVRYSETGEDKRLTLNGILDYFQDTSIFHSQDVGNNMEMLEKQHRAWVLNAWQIIVKEVPKFGECVTLGTWPYEFHRFLGGRNFVMYGEDQRLLACANSLWTYLNTENGRPARIDEDVLAMYPLEPKYDMDYADRKIALPETMTEYPGFPVAQEHLDTNHHVNNGQYVKMASAYLPKDFPIAQLRAEYKKSALLGDRICPKVCVTDEKVTVSLDGEDGRVFTVVEYLRKK